MVASPSILPPCVPQDCGKAFRSSLRKPSPNTDENSRPNKLRVVPAFTIQTLQKNTVVKPPPSCGVYEPRRIEETSFKKSYLRGEFPVCIEFTPTGKVLSWKFPLERLDYHHYLPAFFEGLSEGTYPFSFIVEKGVEDMVKKAPQKVLPVIPQLIVPIKNALATKCPEVICYALRCIQMLVLYVNHAGEALVPYYRQILPLLNLFKMRSRGMADADQIIVREKDVFFLIDDTLALLEQHGGPDAFINLKYMIPTYESCMNN